MVSKEILIQYTDLQEEIKESLKANNQKLSYMSRHKKV